MVDDRFVLRAPANLDLAGVAPLLCAGITTYSPLRHWGITTGKKVGIVGLGGLGHMGVKIAHALGAHVVVFSTSPNKREDAIRLGADEVPHRDAWPPPVQEGARTDDVVREVAQRIAREQCDELLIIFR